MLNRDPKLFTNVGFILPFVSCSINNRSICEMICDSLVDNAVILTSFSVLLLPSPQTTSR